MYSPQQRRKRTNIQNDTWWSSTLATWRRLPFFLSCLRMKPQAKCEGEREITRRISCCNLCSHIKELTSQV
jgi:hypothetical protein